MARRLAPWFLAALLLVTAGLPRPNPPAGHLLVTGLGLVPAGKNRPRPGNGRWTTPLTRRWPGAGPLWSPPPSRSISRRWPDILPRPASSWPPSACCKRRDGRRVAVLVAANLDQAALDKALLAAGIKGAPPAAGALPRSWSWSPRRPPPAARRSSGGPGRPAPPPPRRWCGRSGGPGHPVLDPAPLVGNCPPTPASRWRRERRGGHGPPDRRGPVLVGRLRTHPLVTSEGSPPPCCRSRSWDRPGQGAGRGRRPRDRSSGDPGPDAPRQVRRPSRRPPQAHAPGPGRRPRRASRFPRPVAKSPDHRRSALPGRAQKFEQALQGLPALVEAFRRESVAVAAPACASSSRAPPPSGHHCSWGLRHLPAETWWKPSPAA